MTLPEEQGLTARRAGLGEEQSVMEYRRAFKGIETALTESELARWNHLRALTGFEVLTKAEAESIMAKMRSDIRREMLEYLR